MRLNNGVQEAVQIPYVAGHMPNLNLPRMSENSDVLAFSHAGKTLRLNGVHDESTHAKLLP